MNFKNDDDLKSILHPYLFVLQEGKTISNDFLDYSLMMLQVSCHEAIRSPDQQLHVNPMLPNLRNGTRSPQETATKSFIGS